MPQSLPRRLAFRLTLGVTLFAIFSHLVLLPLHEHGVWQGLLGYLQGADFILQIPGLWLAQRIGLRGGHHTTLGVWLFAVAVNAVIYFLVGLWFARRRTISQAAAETRPPTSPARRRFLSQGARLLGVGAAAGVGYSMLIAPRWFGVTRRQITIRDLPPELDGLRIVQLTDIHHGPWLSLRYVREVIDASNDLAPDLVCLTGDYVHHSASYVEPVVAEMARLEASIGVVAILGNHDWWEDVDLMRRAFAKANIPLLDNDRRILTTDRKLVTSGERGLALCGVGDLWEGRPDYRRALAGLPADMPRLLLSHNPDVAEERGLIDGGYRVDLMLSGHTHGGQVVLPFVGAPATSSRYGQKYAQGLVQGPVCPVFVCRGIGVSGFPVRLGAPPEMALLELRRG